MLLAPFEGWRHVAVRDRQTAIDFAHILKDLADTHLPKAERITLVQDNLNTHNPASLYKAFLPDEARRIAERFERYFTPKHGSWLNIAECEISTLARQCLDRRMPDHDTLANETKPWETERNTASAKVKWRFSTKNARIKLAHLSHANRMNQGTIPLFHPIWG